MAKMPAARAIVDGSDDLFSRIFSQCCENDCCNMVMIDTGYNTTILRIKEDELFG